MVKFSEYHSKSELEDIQYVADILYYHQNPIQKLTQQLQKKQSRLSHIISQNQVKKLSDFILGGVIKLTNDLEKAARAKINTDEIEMELLVYLRVHRKMKKNQTYCNLKNEIEDNSYLKTLVWSSKMVLSEEILILVSEFSFDKSMKLFYYYFKYYMSHLNLFYQNQIKIKNLFLCSNRLDFIFTNQHQQSFNVSLQNLQQYANLNSLHNSYAVATHINQSFHLGLSEDQYIFHALMAKIRIVLETDRNVAVRVVIVSYWIFSFIDLWIKQGGQKIPVFPQVFTISPNYQTICKNLLSIFFIKQAQEKTHCLVLQLIDSIEELQDKIGLRQLSGGLIDNIELVIIILTKINDGLAVKTEQTMEIQSNMNSNDIDCSCFCLQVFLKSENIEKVLKILYNNMDEAVAIHHIIEEIAQKIYNRTSIYDFNESVIDIAGSILMSLEVQDQQILDISLRNILEIPEQASPYIRTISTLLETNYLRQRRDSGTIARRVAESTIFDAILPIFKKQAAQKIMKKSILMNIISLISNLCSQNPVLILLLEKFQLMDVLLDFLKSIGNLQEIENFLILIQFLHNVCLKQCEFRERVLTQYLGKFICGVFTHDIYRYVMISKHITALWSQFNRLLSNIPSSLPYFFNGIYQALILIHQNYEKLDNIQIYFKQSGPITTEMKNNINQLTKLDRKFLLVSKIVERMFTQYPNKTQYDLFIYRIIFDMVVICNRSLLSFPTESRSMTEFLGEKCEKYSDKIIELLKRNQQGKRQKEEFNKTKEVQISDFQNITLGSIENTQIKEFDSEKMKEPSKEAIQKKLKIFKHFLITKEIPRYVSMLGSSLASYQLNKKMPRKILQIFLTETQFTSNLYHEIVISYYTARVEKFISCFFKDRNLRKLLEREAQKYIPLLALVPRISEIVSLEHYQVMRTALKKINGITTQCSPLVSRDYPLTVISEQRVGKQLQDYLQEKKSFFHNLFDVLVKWSPKPRKPEFQKYLKIGAENYLNYLVIKTKQIRSQDSPTLYILQKCRCWTKILIQFLGGTNQDVPVKYNRKFAFLEYCLSSDKDLLGASFQIIHNIMMFLSSKETSRIKNLPDTAENRLQVCQKILKTMNLARLGHFVQNFNYFDVKSYSKVQPNQLVFTREQRYINAMQILSKLIITQIYFISQFNFATTDELVLMEVRSTLQKVIQLTKKDFYVNYQKFGLSADAQQKISASKQKAEKCFQDFIRNLLKSFVFPIEIAESRLKIIQEDSEKNLKEIYNYRLLIKEIFEQASLEIIRTGCKLFKDYKPILDFTKKKVESIWNEPIEYQTVDIRFQVNKMKNIILFLFKMLQVSKQNKQFTINYFTPKYMTELLNQVVLIIGNIEHTTEEDRYSKEADSLVFYATLLIRQFNSFSIQKKQFIRERKREKKREKRKLKTKINRSKVQQKLRQRLREATKSERKNFYDKNMNQDKNQNILKRDKSRINLGKIVSTPQNSKKPQNKKTKRSLEKLKDSIISFFKVSFAASENQPFLTPQTLQTVMVIMTSLMIQEQNPIRSNSKAEKIVEIDLNEILPSLLKTKIGIIRHSGLFHVLSEIAVQFLKRDQVTIDIQIGIKRLFYEKRANKILYRDFKKLIGQLASFDVESFSYFLQLQYTEDNQERYAPISKKFITKYKNKNNLYICMKDNAHLHIINYASKNLKKKKSVVLQANQQQNTETIIKTVDYVPEKSLQHLVYQLIYNIIRLMVKGIIEAEDLNNPIIIKDENQENNKSVNPFNIPILTLALQVLMRWSPSLAPYITKYKCRKILLQVFNELNAQQKVIQYVQDLLNLHDKKQLTFLALVIRGVNPLLNNNIIYKIIFEMCLDNTVLQKQKIPQTGNNQSGCIPFGEIVRHRVICEIEEQIGRSKYLLKKMILMNMLVYLMPLQQICLECINTHSFMDALHKNFVEISRKMKQNKSKDLSFICKKILIPFFLSPLQVLHQLNISLQLDKKKKSNRIKQLGLLLDNDSIEKQFVNVESLNFERKFKQEWPYIGLQASNEEQFDDQSEQSYTSLFNDSEELDLHQIPEEDPMLGIEISYSSDNSDRERSQSWINTVSEDQSNQQQIQFEDDMYPILEQSDHIIQEEDSEEDESMVSDIDLDDMSSGQLPSQSMGLNSINSSLNSVPRMISNRFFDNSDRSQIIQQFESIVNLDRQMSENLIFKLGSKLETHLSEVVKFFGGDKTQLILKFQPIRQIFGEEMTNMKYTEYMQFENHLKVDPYYLQPSREFEHLLSLEDNDLIEILKRYNKKIDQENLRQNIIISHEKQRERRPGFIIHNPNPNQNLLQIHEQAHLMDEREIADQIRRVNNNQGLMQNLIEQNNSHQHSDDGEDQQNQEQVIRQNNLLMMESEDPNISRQQLQHYLRQQNFSYEQYMRLPSDIRDDIRNNILFSKSQNYQQMLMQEELRGQEHHRQLPLAMRRIESQEDDHNINQNSSQNSHISVSSEPISDRSHGHDDFDSSSDSPSSENHMHLSVEHTQKRNKDRFTILNRDGKNDNKYYQCSDQFIGQLLELMLFTLHQSDFVYFPIGLIRPLCINSQNQLKILSTLVGLMQLGPQYKQTSNKPNILPITKSVSITGEIIEGYQKMIYPLLSLKILYTLNYLTKEYSISTTMMNKAFMPIKQLDMPKPQEENRTMLEILISLLKHDQISKQAISLIYLIKTINNITMIKFNAHIYSLHSESKNKNFPESEKQKNATLHLCQENNKLICSLLQNDYIKEQRHLLSSIITRLSIDEENISNFIKYFQKIIKDLASTTLEQLNEVNKKSQKQSKASTQKSNYKEKVLKFYSESKIVQLLNVFHEIMKSFKLAVISENRSQMIDQLKKVLLCQEIKQLCETGCEIIVSDPNAPMLVAKVHQFIDCFFAVYNMLKISDSAPKALQQKIKIASLKTISGNMQLNKQKNYEKKFISNFIDLGGLWQKKVCTPMGKAFINANIKSKLTSLLKNVKKDSQSFLELPIIGAVMEIPHMLEFQNKKLLFKAEIKRVKQKKHMPPIYLLINRDDVFQQSFNEIISKKAEQLKGKFQIEFEGEEGQDAGGLTRQWFQLLSKEMFNPNYALFTPSSTGNTYQPSSKSYVNEQHEKFFKFIGRVMGKALHDGYLLDAYFTPAFYKHILSLPISYEDMQEQDFQFFKSLKWILNNSPIEQYMQLYFTYQFDNFGQMQTRQLCENGDTKLVTEENKIQYVELISYAKMATAVKKQLESFLEGFYEIIPTKLIKIFDEKQLEVMISGLPTIDINDLKQNTDLVNYNKNDQIIIWLFEVLEEFDMSLRTSFLQFVTGTSRVPSDGFKGLQGFHGQQRFNIHKDYETNHLPRAHTCFNQLDLPTYDSKQVLKKKLTIAITQAKEGFGMI